MSGSLLWRSTKPIIYDHGEMNIKEHFSKVNFFYLISRVSFFISIVVCAAIAFVYLYAARPMSDDYGRADCQMIFEAISRTSGEYMAWTGRWAAIGLQYIGWSLIPQLSPSISVYYSLFLAVIWALMFASVTVIVWLLFGRTFRRTLFISALLTCFYFPIFHDLGETIYWIPGATEGGLAVVLMSLAVWLVISGFIGRVKTGWMYRTSVFLCLLLAPGCHELAGLIECVFFSLMLVWYYFSHGRRISRILSHALIYSIVGTSISVFAPGNFVRASLFVDEPSIAQMANTLIMIITRTLRVIISPQMLVALPLVFIAVRKYPDALRNLRAFNKILFPTSVAMLSALMIVAILYSYKMGGNLAPRTINIFCTATILVVVPSMIAHVIGLTDHITIKTYPCVESILVLLLGVSMILGPNIDKGFFSYNIKLIPWIQDQESRSAMLLMHSKDLQKDILIDPGPPAPPLLNTRFDTDTDQNSWANRLKARYYAVRSVRMDKPK